MPSPTYLMRAQFAHPVAQFALAGPASLGDDATLLRVMTSAELRQMAGQWRATCDADDAAQAERVASALEWLADQREPRTRLRTLGDRVLGWLRP